MKKMLIAVDFSATGNKTAYEGYLFAQRNGMDVVFFHCAPMASSMLERYDIKAFISPAGKAEQEEIEKLARKNLHQIMEEVISRLGKLAGTNIEEYVEYGDPADEILSYAKENAIDMIVVGYKNYSMLEEFLIGSTASKVVKYAPCSVLVIRPDKITA